MPLNTESEIEVRRFQYSPSTSVEFLGIDDERMYERLWGTRLFQRINTHTGAMIDDYEEEIIEAEHAGGIRAAIDETEKIAGTLDADMAEFLQELRSLAAASAQRGMPLLFVL